MSKWKTKSLKDLTLQITDGKHGDCQNQNASGYFFISCKDIYGGKINYDNARQITHNDYLDTHKRTRLEVNDILITNSGTIGRMAFINNPELCTKTTFQKSVAIVKPDSQKIYPKYLYYLLQNLVDDFINSSNGSAQKNLLLSTMRSFSISYLEDIKEQRKIADVLSAYDDLIENNRKQIKLLEEAAQRFYKEWFIDLRFPGYENTKIINGIPAGWEKKKLIEIADITMGQSPKSEFYNSNRDGLPFHQGVGSFGTRFVIDETYSSSFSRVAESGDILFSVRAPVGRLNITLNKIAIGRGLAAIKQKNNLQSLLYYMLKEHFFKDDIIGNGSIFASITKDELTNFVLLVPRQDICEKFNTLTKDIDSKIMILDKQIREIKEARDRLLPKLMNGELEV